MTDNFTTLKECFLKKVFLRDKNERFNLQTIANDMTIGWQI